MILRITRPFNKMFSYKIWYYSYDRSPLEFACVLWSPQYAVHIDRLEKNQKKFLNSLDHQTEHFFVNYETAATRYHVNSLIYNYKYIVIITRVGTAN